MMTPEQLRAMREELRQSMPRIEAGDDPMAGTVCFDALGELREWDRPPTKPAIITMRRILEAVIRVTGVPHHRIYGSRRTQETARARQIAAYMIMELCPRATTGTTGRFLKRDHTTIYHAHQRIRELLQDDGEVQEVVRLAHAVLNKIPEPFNGIR